MPRIRSIKPEHWEDNLLPKISIGAHLLWIGMWNFSDDKGVMEQDYHLIKSNVFPRRKEIKPSHIEKWVKELIKYNFILPFEDKGIQYIIHRTFDIHQRIDKPQKSKISEDVIRRVFDECYTNDNRRLDDGSDTIRRKERIGEDRIRKGGKEERNKTNGDFVCYDAEKFLLEDTLVFEKICMATGKEASEVKTHIHKYHLWMASKENYPLGKKAVEAGIESWILNEKNFNKNGQRSTSTSDKLGTSAARVKTARDW